MMKLILWPLDNAMFFEQIEQVDKHHVKCLEKFDDNADLGYVSATAVLLTPSLAIAFAFAFAFASAFACLALCGVLVLTVCTPSPLPGNTTTTTIASLSRMAAAAVRPAIYASSPTVTAASGRCLGSAGRA